MYYGEESGLVALVAGRRPGRRRPVVGPSGHGFVLRGRLFVLRGGVWARRLGRRSSSGSSLSRSSASWGKVLYYGGDFLYYGEESGLVALVVGRCPGRRSPVRRPLGSRFCITGETFCTTGRSLGSLPWSSVVVRVVVVPFVGPSGQGFVLRG